MMRDVVMLVIAPMLIMVQGALGAIFDVGVLMPDLALPVVIYLAMAPDVSLARGSVTSFWLGLVLDSAAGNAMGLLTFVHVAAYLVARAAGFRLLIRGRLSQIVSTAALALLGSITMIALRAIFRPTGPIEVLNPRHVVVAVVSSALCTGAVAPFIYQALRRLDALRRREESTATTL